MKHGRKDNWLWKQWDTYKKNASMYLLAILNHGVWEQVIEQMEDRED